LVVLNAARILQPISSFYSTLQVLSSDLGTLVFNSYTLSGVNLILNLGVVDPGYKNRFFQASVRIISIFLCRFSKQFRFLQTNFRQISISPGKFRKNFDFSGKHFWM